METVLIIVLVLFLLGGGGWDILVGAGSVRGSLTCPRSRPLWNQKPI